tara:strand:+ start:184 stop:690 length:507 start_codon:yes stop_codon:yes gene_type:complete
MERRLNKKTTEFIQNFKSSLNEKISCIEINEADKLDLLNYIYSYEKFEFNKEDFMKRKRVKNMVPMYERCTAKRANGEQCTRRKREGICYCGTHSKGTPHGVVNNDDVQSSSKKVEVSAIDIKGIVYYLDNEKNVYDTQDILSNKINPRVIAKYEKDGENYRIPELFK